jgi:hypothetical protein
MNKFVSNEFLVEFKIGLSISVKFTIGFDSIAEIMGVLYQYDNFNFVEIAKEFH